jgi:ribosomal protein S18 acetylase RimI-like enzyme
MRHGCPGGPDVPTSPGVRLRRMREDEWEGWAQASRERYGQQMATMGGMTPEDAAAKATADFLGLLPKGMETRGQHFFIAEHDGADVGLLWLGERRHSEDGPAAWVFEIEVHEPHRRQGHGRELMGLAEEEARRLGYDTVVLNVFAANAPAIALYEALGYAVTRTYPGAQNMVKRLAPPRPSPAR